jgi:hypothetical protein
VSLTFATPYKQIVRITTGSAAVAPAPKLLLLLWLLLTWTLSPSHNPAFPWPTAAAALELSQTLSWLMVRCHYLTAPPSCGPLLLPPLTLPLTLLLLRCDGHCPGSWPVVAVAQSLFPMAHCCSHC